MQLRMPDEIDETIADVAIAEAGVGACLTTAILVIAIKSTKRMEDEK